MKKFRVLYLAITALALLPAFASAQVVTDRTATALGFSAPRLKAIDDFYAAKVAKGEMAGVVILVARHGRLAHLSSIGYADIANKKTMARDTIFRAYSMTKPVAATALMMLYEEGHFQLDDPVSKYIPEFASLRVLRTPGSWLADTVLPKREPTIRDLLGHTSGLSHGLFPNAVDTEYLKQNVFGLDVSLADMTAKLSKIPLLHQPGATWEYSVAPDVEARLVEIFSGMPFDRFLKERLFKPLRMKDSGFWVDTDRAARLTPVYWSKDGVLTAINESNGYPEGMFISEPWSVNSYTAEHPRKGGSYGMLTTAEDYWHFAQMLLDRGTYDGQRLLSPYVVRLMVRNHLDEQQLMGFQSSEAENKGVGFGLGFAVVEDAASGGFKGSEGTFYWGGAANTHFWVDPKQDLVVVALAQDMVNPGNTYADLEGQIRTFVYSALLE